MIRLTCLTLLTVTLAAVDLDTRFSRLARGVNVSHWLAQAYNVSVDGQQGGYSDRHAATWITSDDAARIHALGCTHIRLPVEPTSLMAADGGLNASGVARLDRAIALFVAQGLAVVVDPVHPQRTLQGLSDDAAKQEHLIVWWTALAAHLAETTDPEHVFLELANEPGGKGFPPARWAPFQERLAAAVRAAAPEHTLILNPGGYQLINELLGSTPHSDPNSIDSIHFYEPSHITHQGALWMRNWYRPLRDVPWPLTTENLPSVLAGITEDGPHGMHADHARKALRSMVESGQGSAEHLRSQIAKAATWARTHGRRIYVGEFGVYRAACAPAVAASWTRASRQAFEEEGMGWCLWLYAGPDPGFGLVETTPNGERRLVVPVAEALGLNPEQ